MSEARLEHAYVSVKDLDRSLSFYRRILPDWTIRWEGRGEGGRWIHYGPPASSSKRERENSADRAPAGAPADEQPGYLSLAEQPDARAFDPYAALGPQHIGFAHADVDGLIARLRPEIEPDDYVDDGAYRRVYYSDPDGIELEFVQKL